MLSKQKKFVFGFITLCLFICLLALTEFLLRISAPSLDNPFIREITADGIESYEINRSYLKKYFPANSAIIPELKPTIFRKHKTPQTFRIICLGESSMFGTPYQLNTNIPGIVRKQLRHLYPDKEIEVINLGAAAINSNVILDLTKNIFELQPDLILIYTGHNEFYGPDGVGASWIQKCFPWTIHIKYSFNDFRFVKLFEQYTENVLNENQRHERNLMKQVAQNNKVHLHSDASDRIFALFESNMNAIVSDIKEHHVPLILSDVTSNLMFPPFMYDTTEALQRYQHELSSFIADYQAENNYSALEKAKALYLLDSSNAFLNYAIGRIYLALNKPYDAKPYLQRARDEDLLKFRAPQHINEIIRKITLEQHVPFISSDSLFAQIEPNGIPGNDLFREHLHPNARGYYEIGTLFTKKIVELKLLSAKSTKPTDLLPFNYDSLSIPWIDLAYGDISIQRLTTQWPFQNYKAQMFVPTPVDDVLKNIAVEMYMSKISLTEGCYKTAARFLQLHKYQDALTTYSYLSEEYPHNYYPYYLSGVVYKEMGDVQHAEEQYILCLQHNPSYMYAHIDIGLLNINSGKFDDAISHFRIAEQAAMNEQSSSSVKATIYYGLSAAYANKNDMDQALYFIDKSLHLDPTYDAAKQLRQSLHAIR
jgi:tetratricopeptide (TPR) repeat protein